MNSLVVARTDRGGDSCCVEEHRERWPADPAGRERPLILRKGSSVPFRNKKRDLQVQLKVTDK